MPTPQVPPLGPSGPQSPEQVPTSLHHHCHDHHIIPPITAGVAAAFLLAIALALYFYKLIHKRAVLTLDSKPPHFFSYSALRRATSSFSSSHLLGRGGFGSVYSGTLNYNNNHQGSIAVKVMDAGSLQGEREFQNELFLAAKFNSKYISSLIGFSSDRKQRRMLLVYELMANGSLQSCLLHCKSNKLRNWRNRFSIANDIAKGLEYLHHYCDPPVIHGDIKPSNILLNSNLNAKIGDFGLATIKSEYPRVVETKKELYDEDNGSGTEYTDSVITTNAFEELHVGELSPESFIRVMIGEASPEAVVDISTASTSKGLDTESVSEGNLDKVGIASGRERLNGKGKRSGSGKDWWWKQGDAGEEPGRVKDYVREWIGNEIKKERPSSEWIGGLSSSTKANRKAEKKKRRARLDWWVSLEEEKNVKREKRRPVREWWNEEYCEEIERKKKKKKEQENIWSTNNDMNGENWWPKDYADVHADGKKEKNRSWSSQGGVDWCLAPSRSQDSVSGDIPKSGGVSSTPNMRGTICYIAPEHCGGAGISEKCDVYSFGVVLLVLISGRRPLQVTGSSILELKRANLVSWARHLSRAGKLLDLVDPSIRSLDKEQALLCITLALVCLQKSPARRPSMKNVVAMLSGDLEPPGLPAELSPLSSSPLQLKTRRKKAR